MRTRVKICGITRVEDALAAVDSGVDALGFMFYENSKRHVTTGQVRRILESLPPFVTGVGVFVNPDPGFVRSVMETTGIGTLQFHGDESPDFLDQFKPFKRYKAVRIKDPSSLDLLRRYECVDAFLLDAHVAGELGGTGTSFDWDLAVRAGRFKKPIILAGGLTVANVRQAVEKVKPFGVDVSSGVESQPGIKDPIKMADFIRATREADTI